VPPAAKGTAAGGSGAREGLLEVRDHLGCDLSGERLDERMSNPKAVSASNGLYGSIQGD